MLGDYSTSGAVREGGGGGVLSQSAFQPRELTSNYQSLSPVSALITSTCPRINHPAYLYPTTPLSLCQIVL